MKIGFVMDPIEGVNVYADTTFALMLGAQARGYELFYIRPETLAAHGDEGWAVMQSVRVRQDPADKAQLGEPFYGPLHELDSLWMRKDPPFDEEYLYDVAILELAEQKGTLVVNRPQGLRAANEKLYALHFPEVIPHTVVTSQAERIKEFMGQNDGMCVLKPLHGHGGAGIFVASIGDRNLNAMIEVSTKDGSERVMVQQYLPQARQGDKRIIMVNGEPIGAILRVPADEEHRGNIHVGGQVVKTVLSKKEQEICELVGPRLVRDGLYFVGLDIIGEKVTEVNVTSPTGIQEMSRLDGVDGPALVMDWLEKTLKS